MPSSRKQKAKEKRSRQSDIMSDVENVDIMIGSYARDEVENNGSENEMKLDSRSSQPQQNSNLVGEDFRSLLNTNSRENSEITIETTRMISEEISNQMSRKLNEIKTNLNFQIHDAISNAITEKILPSIQNTLELQGGRNFTMADQGSDGPHDSTMAANSALGDRRSSGLQWNPEAGNAQKTWGSGPRKCFMQETNSYGWYMSRQSSEDSISSEQNRDNKKYKRFSLKVSSELKVMSNDLFDN